MGKYSINVKGPALYLVGPYKISGRVLVLPIQGEGKSNITLGKHSESFPLKILFHNEIIHENFSRYPVEPEITMTFDGKSVKRNNNEYLAIENAKLSFKVNR